MAQANKCQINIKGIDCEIVQWYRSLAVDNERSLNRELINVLKEFKKQKEGNKKDTTFTKAG